MAKRSGKSSKKSFNIDVESLLISECSRDVQNKENSTSSESCPKPKRVKISKIASNNIEAAIEGKDIKSKITIEEKEDFKNVMEFVENTQSNCSKSLNVKKARLEKFTESIMSMYQNKIGELINIQEKEIQKFKKEMVDHIQEELNKCEEEFNNMKQQENKLMKVLELLSKLMQKSSSSQLQWIENFSNLHKNFVQEYEELKNKHKNEILEVKKFLNTEVSSLQNKFLIDAKKEEINTIKKYFSSVYL